ncbi:MAG: glycosyltransferase family 2 protein [Actinobacteria bacterium]|nr:glycosyltransferase family 2 protein [Actinomycetota bacterium]
MINNKKSLKSNTLAIIPCYNEEMTIGSIVLKSKRYVDTVLVINDGSNDDTARIAKDAGAVVISHEKNSGKSACIKTGFHYALKNDFAYVVTLDGDGQHNADEIPILLENLMKGDYDISIGYRTGNNTEMPLWRKIGKRVLDYATSAGNGGFITDSQCGFRAFSKKAIEAITPRLNGENFTVESEQLIRAHEMKLKIVNTKVTCKYENLDTSTKNPASHGFSVLNYVIWLVAEKRPLLFIGVPGFISVIIGLLFGILTLQYYNKTHVFLISYAIIVSIFLIIGALAMFIGLMLNVLPRIIKKSK